MQDSIFLYGPPGVGKSTLGLALAEHFGCPFFDLDALIEIKAGKSIKEIFSSQGERTFRQLESKVLKELAGSSKGVFALGGGCLIDPKNRAFAFQKGEVVCLLAEFVTLLERIGQKSTGRPLLDVNPGANLSKLLEDRDDHYQGFEKRISVDGKSAEMLLWELQTVLRQFAIPGMGERYDVVIKRVGLQTLDTIIKQRDFSPPYFLIIDDNINKLYPSHLFNLQQDLGQYLTKYVFPAGEFSKNIRTVQSIWHEMLSAGIDRGGTVVALGGGVTGDISGFAAATFMRGIPWINLPTSLLAMVDASLGGKTGVNLPKGKNLVGAFYPPKFVLVNPDFLSTLPENEFLNGCSEILKHGVVGDPKLFIACQKGKKYLQKNIERIIAHAISVKAQIVIDDPFEQGIRESLNFGHTIGHAVEKLSNFRLGHGESVAIGMVLESGFAEDIGIAERGLSHEIKQTLTELGLPVEIPAEIKSADILEALQKDKKKRQEKICFSLPERIGKVKVKVEIPDLEKLLAKKLEAR